MKNARLVFIFLSFVFIFSCNTRYTALRTVLTQNNQKTPKILALYPILSTQPKQGTKGFNPSTIIMHPNAKIDEGKKKIVIAPPTETNLTETANSKIFNGLLSTELALKGFQLKELLYDIYFPNDNGNEEKPSDQFVISLDLLEKLKNDYGLQALIMGNAFFRNVAGLKKITSLHLEIIDVNTLDVLAQINLPYNFHGEEINDVARFIAKDMSALK